MYLISTRALQPSTKLPPPLQGEGRGGVKKNPGTGVGLTRNILARGGRRCCQDRKLMYLISTRTLQPSTKLPPPLQGEGRGGVKKEPRDWGGIKKEHTCREGRRGRQDRKLMYLISTRTLQFSTKLPPPLQGEGRGGVKKEFYCQGGVKKNPGTGVGLTRNILAGEGRGGVKNEFYCQGGVKKEPLPERGHFLHFALEMAVFSIS